MSSGRSRPYFRERYRTIVPDLRGHGRSEHVHDGHTVAQYARDLRAPVRGRHRLDARGDPAPPRLGGERDHLRPDGAGLPARAPGRDRPGPRRDWSDDTLVPVAAEEYAVSQMPDARLVVLEESGHCPFLAEPERFNQVVDEFVRSL